MQAHKHFLSLADLTPADLHRLLDLAVELKREWRAGGNAPLLKNKTLAMVFTKPSLRTRVSFEMAMRHLGGHAMYIAPDEIQLGKRESVPDVARVLSRYVDGIMARVFAHADVVTLAEHSRVPVINGLSDYSHPCQGLADLLTILEYKGSIRGLTIAYVGDANNVTNSLVFGGTLLGAHMRVGSPEGYQLRPDVAARAAAFAQASGGSLTQLASPQDAVRDADVVYTDVWTSMGQEAEAARRAQVFPPYQVNQALVNLARRDAIVMHCLPAHRGQEITDDVADGPQSALWDQAENRMHAQKAVLVTLMG
ncbi:MAG: ornithine carbamoyltransferase [Anaerolineae bacterium]|nr:ornithine carbamoyltransferase [Thermoflexales bacterium]MDW8406943.1 ornithine carbamoyltransferase [Anaerolineae bacterium]